MVSPTRRVDRLRLYHGLILGGRARVAGDLHAALEEYRRIPLDPAAMTDLGVADVGIVLELVRSNVGTAEYWTGDPATAAVHLRRRPT